MVILEKYREKILMTDRSIKHWDNDIEMKHRHPTIRQVKVLSPDFYLVIVFYLFGKTQQFLLLPVLAQFGK